MGQYDDVECTLATCVFHDTTKYGCNHHDAVNKIEIRLKTQRHAIPASRFAVEYTTEGAAVCDVASRVDELTFHAVANVVKMLVQTLVVL